MTPEILTHRVARVRRVYQRHFAGKDRRTRDPSLLRHAIAVLEDPDVTWPAELTDTIDGLLDSYRTELGLIEAAQRTGSDADRVSLLRWLGDRQMQAYQTHFAGKARVSRSAGRLHRMLAELLRLRAGLQGLDTSLANRASIATFQETAARAATSWKTEHDLILEAQRNATPTQRAAALGGAANDVFAVYKEHFEGQPRATRDPLLLSSICDRLQDIAEAMEDLGEAGGSSNPGNLEIVRRRLDGYEREYDAVLAAVRASQAT